MRNGDFIRLKICPDRFLYVVSHFDRDFYKKCTLWNREYYTEVWELQTLHEPGVIFLIEIFLRTISLIYMRQVTNIQQIWNKNMNPNGISWFTTMMTSFNLFGVSNGKLELQTVMFPIFYKKYAPWKITLNNLNNIWSNNFLWQIWNNFHCLIINMFVLVYFNNLCQLLKSIIRQKPVRETLEFIFLNNYRWSSIWYPHPNH